MSNYSVVWFKGVVLSVLHDKKKCHTQSIIIPFKVYFLQQFFIYGFTSVGSNFYGQLASAWVKYKISFLKK